MSDHERLAQRLMKESIAVLKQELEKFGVSVVSNNYDELVDIYDALV